MRKLKESQREELAKKLIELIEKLEFDDFTFVYYNGKKIELTQGEKKESEGRIDETLEEKYAKNAEILITFEGIMHDVVSSRSWPELNELFMNKLEEILEKYSVDFELIHSWAMGIYKK